MRNQTRGGKLHGWSTGGRDLRALGVAGGYKRRVLLGGGPVWRGYRKAFELVSQCQNILLTMKVGSVQRSS